MKVYLLNSPVLTDWGVYVFRKISLEQAKDLVKKYGFISAIGHESTAKMLSELLEVEVPVNRVAIRMLPGEVAIIFRIKERLPEGKILNYEELKKLIEEEKAEFGLLVKTF